MGTQVGLIDGRRDIIGGRNSADMVGAASANRSKHFTTVTYTSDGSCILAGTYAQRNRTHSTVIHSYSY